MHIVVLISNHSFGEDLGQKLNPILKGFGGSYSIIENANTPIKILTTVMISTFKTFEAATRYPFYWDRISHVLIENLQCIGDVEGYLLEALVCRFMLKSPCQILTGCLPAQNIGDLSRWLLDAQVMTIQEATPSYRNRTVLGFPHLPGRNHFQFETGLNCHLVKLLKKTLSSILPLSFALRESRQKLLLPILPKL